MAIELGIFGKRTATSLAALHKEDEQRKEPKWKTPWPLFNKGIIGLINGLILVSGAENVGKSNVVTNIGRGILDCTPDSILVDVTLDDSYKKKGRFMVASKGRLSMKDVTLPSLLPEDSIIRQSRTEAYKSLIKEYGHRYEIVDNLYLAEMEKRYMPGASQTEILVEYLRQVRYHFGPEAPIWVNIDAFDDLAVPDSVTKRGIDPVYYKSQVLKDLTAELDIVICCTKHQNKGNRFREASTEALGGAGRLRYDAEIILLLYAEVAELGQSAEIYFQRDDILGEDGEPVDDKFPVLEMTFRKNKADDFKGKIFFYQYPEQYYCEECGQEEQTYYRDAIRNSVGGSKKNS